MQESTTINARMEPALWQQVKEFAKANDLTASQVLRKALREYLVVCVGPNSKEVG